MRISDEIREWCDKHEHESNMLWKLRNLADRIDDEMVELPKDADGVPIHVGDEVYTPSGNVANVTSIRFHVMCSFHGGGGVSTTFFPTDLTHARPDSLERIADELDGWRVAAAVDCRIKAMDEDTVHDLAERIRKLAKEGEHATD